MEWGTPVSWGKFILFCVPQSVKTKETSPTRPGSPTSCKQALRVSSLVILTPNIVELAKIFSSLAAVSFYQATKKVNWICH